MKILDESRIEFNNLYQAASVVSGEVESEKTFSIPFESANRQGDTCDVDSIKAVNEMGKDAADTLFSAFAV